MNPIFLLCESAERAALGLRLPLNKNIPVSNINH